MVLSSFFLGRSTNLVCSGRPCETGFWFRSDSIIKCEVCIYCIHVRKRTHACVHTHAYIAQWRCTFQSVLRIICWKDLCLELVNTIILFSCLNSSRIVHLSFHLIDGRNQGLCSGPSLLAGYRMGTLCPFPSPFFFPEAKGYGETGSTE